jgi:catechol 2,3-dioxygenase-like lactoylglutathione lyase family enzyme
MVKDMDKSISFYRSMGFNRWGDHYTQVTAPGITIGIHPGEESNMLASGNTSIGLTVDNFEEAQSFLNSLSLNSQSRKEEGGQFLRFSDPDGTMLYFIKPNW